MSKVNLSFFGHPNPLTLNEFSDFIIKILNEHNIKTSSSKFLNRESINILFEGHHGLYRKSIKRIFKKSENINKILILTEIIYGNKNLNSSYYTFNDKFLNRNINNEKISYIYLLILNLSYFILKIFKKKFWGYHQKAKKNKFKIKYFFVFHILNIFFSEFDHANGLFYWKERYEYFHETKESYKMLIALNGTEFDYLKKVFDNYYTLHFVHLNKKIEKNIFNKDIDCLFTGQLTRHRKKMLDSLTKSGLIVQHFDYLNENDRRKLHERSKIYLDLKKFSKISVPVGTRAWYCLENGFFIVNEDAHFKNSLYKYTMNVPTNEFVSKIKEIINNYEYYEEIFKKKLNEYKNDNIHNNAHIKKIIKAILSS